MILGGRVESAQNGAQLHAETLNPCDNLEALPPLFAPKAECPSFQPFPDAMLTA